MYLDYNATTPVDARVAASAARCWRGDGFGNPSSDHVYGAGPYQTVQEARGFVAALIGARPEEIVFTGSGSEADQLAIRGATLAALDRTGGPARVITQATEHPAVLASCAALARWHDVEIVTLGVDRDGLLDPALVAEEVARDSVIPTVVSVMVANNETGAIQPVREIAAAAHACGAIVHADAEQAAGKIALDVVDLGVDLLTVVGHKMYAPKGVAALYVRSGVVLEPVIYGGGQERGLRAGTENVALIAALGTAAAIAATELAAGATVRLAALRDRLHARLDAALPDLLHLNGPTEQRLPNTLSVSVDGIPGHALLAGAPGVAASLGSACHSGIHTPSPVLTAMGLTEQAALSAIRLSVGRWTTSDDVDRAAAQLASVAATLLPTRAAPAAGGRRG